ncbi:hypothetical protein KEM52_003532, partial [Ascosphaera acerosa]
ASSGGGTTAADQQTRGLPYYEKLRRELREAIQKKRVLDRTLAVLEDSIYRFEQSYLEETGAGNIIRGFDNYIKGTSIPPSALGGVGGGGGGGGAAGAARRKAQVNDADRIFSRSSASYNRDSPAPRSTTPSVAGTPAPTGPPNSAAGAGAGAGGAQSTTKAATKKKKGAAEKRDRDSETPKPPVKRLKITYGRD